MQLLRKNKSLKNLEYIENKVTDKLLIATKKVTYNSHFNFFI